MTLLERAKEVGVEIVRTENGGEWGCGCPWEHGFETREESERVCATHSCTACYAREYKELTATVPMTIKDSGDRTTFDSGAVRDMHEGKGRCDLLPMCVILRLARHYEAGCQKYGDRNWEKGIPCHSFADSAIRHILKYMDGQKDEDHLIAAIWNLCGLAWTEEKHPELMDIPARLEPQRGDGPHDQGTPEKL